ALVGVELGREAAGVPDGVGRTAGSQHRGEADKDLGLPAVLEHPGPADVPRRTVGAEHAVRGSAPRVDDALGDALMVEVGDLLAQVMILQEDRAAGTGLL